MVSLQVFLSFLPRAPKFPLPLLTPATPASRVDAKKDMHACIVIACYLGTGHYLSPGGVGGFWGGSFDF